MNFPVLWRKRHENFRAWELPTSYPGGMERPNTVSGLLEKRRELEARLKVARTEIKKLIVGLDALDVALRLFGAADVATKPKRLPHPHPAAKGEFQRLALDLFRETEGPITSLMVAKRFCENRDLALVAFPLKSGPY